MTSVQDLLRQHGPMLTSELSTLLVSQGISREAARQRISRSHLESMDELSLPNRQRFVFLPEQRNTDSFIRALCASLQREAPAYGDFLSALTASGGQVHARRAPLLSGQPITNLRGQVRHDNVVRALLASKVLNSVAMPGGDHLVLASSRPDRNSWIAELEVEMLVDTTAKFVSNLNLCASKVRQHRTGEEAPAIGQFAFSITAPSYLAGLRRQNASQGFLAVDVRNEHDAKLCSVRSFLKKLDSLGAQKRRTPIQGGILCYGYEPQCLKELRSRGILVLTPQTMLGKDVAENFTSLIATLRNAAAEVASGSDHLFQLINGLKKVDGAAQNLRGILLELIVARLMAHDGYSTEVRKAVRTQEGATDIDVQASRRGTLICCECKGMAPHNNVSLDEVRDWATRRLPLIKNWAAVNGQEYPRREFRFYSSTGFEKDARSYLDDMVGGHIKQPVNYFGGEEILQQLYDCQEFSIVSIFKEQFGPFRKRDKG